MSIVTDAANKARPSMNFVGNSSRRSTCNVEGSEFITSLWICCTASNLYNNSMKNSNSNTLTCCGFIAQHVQQIKSLQQSNGVRAESSRVWDKIPEGSTYFSRYPNCFTMQCRINRRKPSCQKPARCIQLFRYSFGLCRHKHNTDRGQ